MFWHEEISSTIRHCASSPRVSLIAGVQREPIGCAGGWEGAGDQEGGAGGQGGVHLHRPHQVPPSLSATYAGHPT
jgi:hypothetical protein